MAEYKKKSVKRVRAEREKPERIDMKKASETKSSPQKKTPATRNFKVIKGGKRDNRLTAFLVAAALIVICAAYLIILAFNPIGVFETLGSAYKKIGSGSGYNVSLSGDNIIDVKRHYGFYYVVTDTELLCFNHNGKEISSISHGFSKPIVKTVKTRALLYGQGEKHLKIYNFDNLKFDLEFEDRILCADIAENGNFAVAGYASGYDSVVKIFNKKGEPLYEWYSADGTVSDVSLTPDGKKVFITTFTSKDGVIHSKISLFNYKSANAEKTCTFNNDLPYKVFVPSKNSVFAVFENKVWHLNIKSSAESVKETDYVNTKAFITDGKLTVVSGLAANVEKNNITLYDKNGKVLSDFSADYFISDLAFYRNAYYILSDTQVYKADNKGNLTYKAEITADIDRIVPVSERVTALIKDTDIIKTELKESAS